MIFGFAQWQTQNFAITTGGTPIPPPAAPTGLVASALDATDIGLSWTGSSGATTYKIQRSADGSTGWAQVGASAGTTFTDVGLTPSTTYFYRVVASNGSGDSGPSNVVSATTPGALAYSQSPQGSWVGTYGADGYDLLGWNGGTDLVSLPQSSLVIDQGTRFQWNTSTGAVQALESPDTTARRSTSVYDPNQVRLHLAFSTAYSGSLHLYAMDWDTTNRRETVTVNDGSGPRTANLSADFSQGAWLNAPINVAADPKVNVPATTRANTPARVNSCVLIAVRPNPRPPRS